MSINTIITTLLTQLSKISPPPAPPNPDYNINNINDNNIFTNLSATDTRQLKNLLLTLHCLFPNELLLALDILDRGFVRRYAYTSITANNKSDTKKEEEEEGTLIFIVQSTSSPSNLEREREREREGSDGGGGGGGGNAYQVHLKTWNCSCPAFVLGCFASTTNTANAESEMMTERQEENNDMDAKEESWFGGTLRIPDSSYDDQSIPICKHILACVLVAKCPGLFGRKCLTYEVNDMGKINEVAGWCAA